MPQATAMDLLPVPTQDPTPTSGGRLVTTDGRVLPLRGAHLSAEAGAGIARVTLTQRFVNPHAEPLTVEYLLPLPSDGAVSGFSFTVGERRVIGEVDRRRRARERFEQALAEGRTAALLEEDRTSLFTQTVGNIPPGAEVLAEVVIDQPLRWLEEGAWEWRFPTVVGPRYLGAAGRVPDGERVAVDVASHGTGAGATLALCITDALTGAVESPSHGHDTERGDDGETVVRFRGDRGVALDRDVIVRFPVALPGVGATLRATRPAAPAHGGDTFALLTLVPPERASRMEATPRDLMFLIDTSGSMGGRPLEQAKRVVGAMIDTLGPKDRVELIEFGNRPVRFRPEPLAATPEGRKAARKWLASLRASGGTEMHRAVLEALRPLRPGSQRQVVLVTDGYIGFEQEIVKTLLRDLPEGARLHTVGVGSAVNRSLTEAAARAGRGAELVVGLDEDVERVLPRLLARTSRPLVTDLVIEGEALVGAAPAALPDLYAGAPSLVALRTRGPGALVVRGRTAEGAFEERVTVPALALGEGPEGVTALFGRQRVADLETELSALGHEAASRLDAAIEDTGLAFQIASRLTSWVALTEERTVDPDGPRRAERQPHELPHGLSVEGLGLRAAAMAPVAMQAMAMPRAASMTLSGAIGMGGAIAPPSAPAPGAPPPSSETTGAFARMEMMELRHEAMDFEAADEPYPVEGERRVHAPPRPSAKGLPTSRRSSLAVWIAVLLLLAALLYGVFRALAGESQAPAGGPSGASGAPTSTEAPARE